MGICRVWNLSHEVLWIFIPTPFIFEDFLFTPLCTSLLVSESSESGRAMCKCCFRKWISLRTMAVNGPIQENNSQNLL